MLLLPLLLACQAPPVAIVPAVGDGLPVHELAPIDAAARRAFARRAGALDDASVRARYDSARANGLRCPLTELDCLVQVGVVVGAEQVLMVRARPERATLALVDVSTARWLRRAEVPLGPDLDASMASALAALDAAPPWSDEEAASPGAPAPSQPAGPSLLVLGVGGGIAALGAVALGVGAWPFVQAWSAGQGLASLDAEGRDAGMSREGYLADVEDTRAAYDAGRQAWEGYGQSLVIGGAAFFGVGVGVLVGALVAAGPSPDEVGP